MKIKKILCATLAAVLLLSAFAGCSRIKKIETVGEINGEEFDQNDPVFKYFFNDSAYQILSNVQMEPGTEEAKKYINETTMEDGRLAIEVCREEAAKQTVRLKAELEKAKADGITLTDEEKNALIQEETAYINSIGETQYDKVLKMLGVTREEYRQISEYFTISQKLVDKYATVSDEELNNELAKEEYIAAKHILFQVNSEEEKAEKEKLAKDTLAKIKAGEDFDSFLGLSDDPGQAQSPNGYVFTRGQMVQPFEEAAYALEVDQVSDLVETDYGYHIIKRVVNEELTSQTKATIQSDKYLALVDGWVEEFKGKTFDDALKNIEY